MKIEPKEFTLRTGEVVKLYSPDVEDAQGLAAHFNKVVAETRNLTFRNTDATKTASEEIEWLKKFEGNNISCLLCASIKDKIIGLAEVTHKSTLLNLKHRGTFGISIQKEHWHKGIGKLMMQTLCEYAKNVGLEQVELEVVDANVPARELYKKMGFVEVGAVPHGLKYEDGTYVDLIQMVKML